MKPAPAAAAPARKRRILDASALSKARAATLPEWIEPCLPSAVETPPAGKDWVHEIKYDGYRVQVRLEHGRATLLTRQGLDWTERFPGVAEAVAGMPVKSALIDGEIVVHTEAGIASFTALVDTLKSGGGTLVLYVFDLLYLDGYDLRESPLKDRKAALEKITAAGASNGRIRFSEHIAGDGSTIFRHASRLGLEGIISKMASSPYRSGRSKTWLKMKAAYTGAFVVAGFIPSTVDTRSVGALVLAERRDGKLTPSGHVGSGFTADSARALWHKLDPLRTRTAPLKDETATAKGVKWVEPVVTAEIEYRSRTGSDLIRHAVFRRLLEENETADAKRNDAAPRTRDPVPLVRLTNPGRLFWPEQGITKQGLADFYTEIADWILPHIAGRALSLLRCPGGVQEQCFFQKHRWAGLSERARSVPVPGEAEPMIAIDDLAGLLELVQAGVLEIHPWGSKADRPELPDRATIDLDPGEGVPWERVIEAAFDVRDRLSNLGLRSFVKTTGGKGLHVAFPLSPKTDWDSVKRFTQLLAEDMARDRPDRYTANMAKRDRRGRIYVDYLRNGMGATAVGAYSTRARPGAAVSTPLSWDEIGPGIRANHFTLHNLPKRLAFLDKDPWDGFLSLQQELPDLENMPGQSPMAQARVSSPAVRRGAAEDAGTGSLVAPGMTDAPAASAPRKTPSRRPAVPAASVGAPAPPADGIEPIANAVVPPRDALARYWKTVGTDALEHLGRRPLNLVRHDAGVTFYQRGPLPPVPASVHQMTIRKRKGGESVRLWVDNLDGLLGLLEIGVVELHPWGATVDDIERPDTLVFGLDPGDGIAWDFVIDTAARLHELLSAEGLDSWPKLTGGEGLHVVAPIEPDLDWTELHRYSQEIAERLTATDTQRYVTAPGLDKRRGRLFINYLSNGCGTTAVGAYSPRARAGFPVAVPVTWQALQRGIRPDAFTISKPPRRGAIPRR